MPPQGFGGESAPCRIRSDGVTKKPGTYALVLECTRTERIEIGKLGQLDVQPGVYVYIGSAFGPGGLAARIRHHANVAVRPHWHVDYLRRKCPLVEVWFSDTPVRLEHAWASAVSRMPGAVSPLPRFGSSDCACTTHLFWFQTRPEFSEFTRKTGARQRYGVLKAGDLPDIFGSA